MPKRLRKPTAKQEALISAVKANPDAKLSEIAKEVGYHNSPNVSRALQSPAVKSEIDKFRAAAAKREALQDERLLDHVERGLQERRSSDRKAWFDTALEIRGLAEKPKAEEEKPQAQILIINAIAESRKRGISK